MEYAYLDWAASAPPDPAMLDVYVETARRFPGNPSSPHSDGQSAREVYESARRRCAEGLGIEPSAVVFTSGGTEGNNMVLFSLLAGPNPGSAIVSGVEHPSGYLPAKRLHELGWKVDFIPASRYGVVSARAVAERLCPDTRLVSVMAVNNETGVIQPIPEIVKVVREYEQNTGRKIPVHTDAVQALGKIPVDLKAWDVDSAAFSAHKIGGPRGIGLLYCRSPLKPLYQGGGQEGNMRPGTENIAGAVAFASLFAESMQNPDSGGAVAMDRLLSRKLREIAGCILIPEGLPGSMQSDSTAESKATRFSHAAGDDTGGPGGPGRSPYIRCFAIPPIPGEVLVRVMDAGGFRISTGSACSSRKKDRGRVLEAMGVPRDIWFSSVRVSTGRTTTEEEINSFCRTLRREVEILGKSLGKGMKR